MLIRRPADIRPSEITPEPVYLNRRALLGGALAGGVLAAAPMAAAASDEPPLPAPMSYARNSRYSVDEPPNTYEQITHYNNFYEFGTDKTRPARRRASAGRAALDGHVDGEAEKPGTFTLETSSSRTRSRSASTASAASRPGRW